jgi:hypothetical protein
MSPTPRIKNTSLPTIHHLIGHLSKSLQAQIADSQLSSHGDPYWISNPDLSHCFFVLGLRQAGSRDDEYSRNPPSQPKYYHRFRVRSRDPLQ